MGWVRRSYGDGTRYILCTARVRDAVRELGGRHVTVSLVDSGIWEHLRRDGAAGRDGCPVIELNRSTLLLIRALTGRRRAQGVGYGACSPCQSRSGLIFRPGHVNARMLDEPIRSTKHVLEPNERIAEVLFRIDHGPHVHRLTQRRRGRPG